MGTVLDDCISTHALQLCLAAGRDAALELGKPLVILEALRVRYRWACDRFHRFVIEGMRDHQQQLAGGKVVYYPYVEPRSGAGAGLIEALAAEACLVVTDDYPCFFHPRLIAGLGTRLPARLEAIDSNGLMPLAAEQRTFTVAHSYRRFMQKALPEHLQSMPVADPLTAKALRNLAPLKELPERITSRWPRAELETLLKPGGLAGLPIDHGVGPSVVVGGSVAATRLLNSFTTSRLATYAEDRNQPKLSGSSELSPHLHFGHISAHEVFAEVMAAEGWHPGKLRKPNGKVNGFWGVSENSEAFFRSTLPVARNRFQYVLA